MPPAASRLLDPLVGRCWMVVIGSCFPARIPTGSDLFFFIKPRITCHWKTSRMVYRDHYLSEISYNRVQGPLAAPRVGAAGGIFYIAILISFST